MFAIHSQTSPRPRTAVRRRRPSVIVSAAAVPLVLLAAACSGDDDSDDISVFSVKAGQCFTAPKSVKVQLSTLSRTECSKAHTLESYAVAQYVPAGSRLPSRAPTPTSAVTGVPTSLPSAKPSFAAPSTSVAVDSNYPGEDVLKKFADGTCAERFTDYVGVDYLDSDLFFTYLLPSARSWEQSKDRNVLCFVTTTGGTLRSSVKGSKR